MKTWLNKNIIGFSLASFFSDFCHEMTLAILPMYIQGITGVIYAPFTLGVIQGTADIASTAMKLISGFVADKVKRYKPFLVVGYGLTAFVALIGTTKNLFMILWYSIIAWMSQGIREPLRDTWISKIVSPECYGRVFGFHRASDTLGALCGPLSAFMLLHYNFSITSVFMFALVPGLLAVVPIVLLTHEEKRENVGGVAEKSDITLRNQLSQLPLDFIYFLGVMLIFGFANFNKTLFIYRAQSLLQQHDMSLHVAAGWALLLYTLYNIVRACGEFGMGILSDYIQRKNILAIFGFGLFSVTAVCFVIPAPHISMLSLFFACAGFSAGTVKSLEKSYAATLLPESVRGTGLGLLQTVNGIGNLCSSLIVGGLWSFVSPVAGFVYAAVLSCVAMCMMFGRRG